MLANAPEVTEEEVVQSEAWIRTLEFRKAVESHHQHKFSPEEISAGLRIPGGYHVALAMKLAGRPAGSWFISPGNQPRH